MGKFLHQYQNQRIYSPLASVIHNSKDNKITIFFSGTKKFLALGIPAEKLVLGLPWYGYDYPCSTIDKVCKIHCSL